MSCFLYKGKQENIIYTQILQIFRFSFAIILWKRVMPKGKKKKKKKMRKRIRTRRIEGTSVWPVLSTPSLLYESLHFLVSLTEHHIEDRLKDELSVI